MAIGVALAMAGAPKAEAGVFYWDGDGSASGNNSTTGAGLGGSGSWDLTSRAWWDGTSNTDTQWVNSASSSAIFSGSAGRFSLTTAITAGSLQFNSNNYKISGSGVLTLAGATPSITFGSAGLTATLATVLAGTSGVNVTGGGTLLLTSSANTFSGGLSISTASIVDVGTNDAVLGALGSGITLNNGTLRQGTTGTLTVSPTRTLTLGSGGGTLDITGFASTQKMSLLTGGQLVGSASLTKTGGGTLQIGGANTALVGSVFLRGGVIQVQNAQGLGSNTAPTPNVISIDSGGELAASGVTLSYPFLLSGGSTLSADANTSSTFSGALSLNGTVNVAARGFAATTQSSNILISGALSGTGTFNLVGPLNATGGTVALSANSLNSIALSGPITVGPGVLLSLVSDGDGTANPETITINARNSFTVTSTNLGYSVGRLSASSPATNKTIALATLPNNSGSLFRITALNGFGMSLTGDRTLAAGQSFDVLGTQALGSVPGLSLEGQLSGTSGLLKTGAGTLQLTNAANTFGSGGLAAIDIAGGVLAVSSDGALGNPANNVRLNDTPATLRITESFASGRTLTFNNSTLSNNILEIASGRTFTLNSALNGNNGFLKTGAGTLSLGATHNSYTGATTVLNGGLTIGATNALGTTSILNLGSAANAVSLTINADQTLAALTISGTSSADQLTVAGAKRLTVSGNTEISGGAGVSSTVDMGAELLARGDFKVGVNGSGGSLVMSGGGGLNLNGGSTKSLSVGSKVAASSATGFSGSLDLSGLSTFTANVGKVQVAVDTVGTAGSMGGTLKLATNNSIVASTSFVIGDSLNDATAGINTVTLGSGSNLISTPLLTVGGRALSAAMTLPAGGTLTLNNGTGATNLNVGVNGAIASNASTTGTLDLSGGSFSAMLNTLVVGARTGTPNGAQGGAATGSVLIGSSASTQVTVNTVTIGQTGASSTGTGTGTLSMAGGTLSAGSLTLGAQAGGVATGTLNLTGGTLSVTSGDVRDGGGTSTVILDGGTLDLNGNRIGGPSGAFIDTVVLASGTLRNVGELNGGAPLIKTSTGTLTLAGTNTLTGATRVSAGTLAISGRLTATSSVQVSDGGTLLLAGSQADHLNNAAPVQLGTAGGALDTNATLAIDNSATSSQLSPVAFAETLGALTLSNNSILDLGMGNSGTVLHFAESSAALWASGVLLKIYNWSDSAHIDQVYFGSNSTSLTSDQIAQIQFFGLTGNGLPIGARLLDSGELVPVPEPVTWLGGSLLVGLIGYREARRLGRARGERAARQLA